MKAWGIVLYRMMSLVTSQSKETVGRASPLGEQRRGFSQAGLPLSKILRRFRHNTGPLGIAADRVSSGNANMTALVSEVGDSIGT